MTHTDLNSDTSELFYCMLFVVMLKFVILNVLSVYCYIEILRLLVKKSNTVSSSIWVLCYKTFCDRNLRMFVIS